ncbi:MAG: YibE/F family protein [Chloroflexota bacterium]|nr:MAG: YibE/F family protein [Chloroflexota bacterium]
MKKSTILFILSIIGVVILAGIIILYFIPHLQQAANQPEDTKSSLGFGEDAVKAEVLGIVEEGEIQLGNHTQTYQVLNIRILEGEFAGQEMEIDYGRQQTRPEGLNLSAGNQIIVSVGQDPAGNLNTFFMDFVRTRPLLWLFGTFVVFSVLISGWKGVRSLIGMGISLGVILWYIIPQILAGKNPVLVSVSGAFFLLAVSLYLIYGWTLKTHAAVLGTLLSLIVTALLANFFVDLTRLTGFGNENALFLVQQSNVRINLRGLVLGGMLIGALGVLDDLVIMQASLTFELHILNPVMKFKELYTRSMRVGQDHVAATVNTLVLAYAGAALPMLLLFSLGGEQIGYVLNLEFVTEEIVRAFVGSLGLIAAVPITTLLACLVALNHQRLGKFRSFFGPITLEEKR